MKLSSEKKILSPSEDPILANQAILLERTWHDVTQYKENVQEASALLNYSDQMLGTIHEKVNTAHAKISQALNAPQDATSRRAVSEELQSILESIVNVGNSSYMDRSVFAGTEYATTPFVLTGSDVMFNGNNEAFMVNAYKGEQIQANITANQAFGSMQTSVQTESDLNAALPPSFLSTTLPAGTLTLTESYGNNKASLSVTATATDTLDTLIAKINQAAVAKAATALADSATAAETAWVSAGGAAGLAAALTADAGYSAVTASTGLDAAIDSAARTFLGLGANDALTDEQTEQFYLAKQAARKTFSASEFRAVKTRGGMDILHTTGTVLGVDEQSTSRDLLSSLELINRNAVPSTSTDATNPPDYYYLSSFTSITVNQTLALTDASGSTLNIQLYAGDTLDRVISRINEEVNSMTGVPSGFEQLVASKGTDSTGADALALVNRSAFSMTATDLTNGSGTAITSLHGAHNRIDDLRNNNGMETGSAKLIETLVTNLSSDVTIRAGDSLDYILDQLNNLHGFSAELNSEKNGIQLRNLTRYSYSYTPVAGESLDIFKKDTGFQINADFSDPTLTLSQKAEIINGLSSDDFRVEAAVNTAGELIILSDSPFSLDTNSDGTIDVTNLQINDHTGSDYNSSVITKALGLNKTPVDGVIEGASILSGQVRLSDLYEGEGFTPDKIYLTVGASGPVAVDLSSAATLRDVRDLLEEALPGMLTVELNSSANGLKLTGTGGNEVRIQEYGSGLTARMLGLVTPPATSSRGTVIEGNDLNPKVTGRTLLKNLNDGWGVDLTGFRIKNGSHTTDIQFDQDGDGIDDIRSLNDLVNHINQKSKRDQVYVEAKLSKEGKLIIASKLANTELTISELPAVAGANPPVYGSTASDLGLLGVFSDATPLVNLNGGSGVEHGHFFIDYGTPTTESFKVSGIVPGVAQTISIYNANGSRSALNIDLNDTAVNVIAAIDAASIPGEFEFYAEQGSDGTLSIISEDKFSVVNSDPSVEYVPDMLYTDSWEQKNEAMVDITKAETLGDVRTAIEQATNNEITVSYSKSGRLELKLVNQDPNQKIEFRESSDSANTAQSLGFMDMTTISGRELFDGISGRLTAATSLSDLDLNLTTAVATGSTEHFLTLEVGGEFVSIDLTGATTVGDVLTAINGRAESDKGNPIRLEATIVDGKFLQLRNLNSVPIRVIPSDFNDPAEKLGLIPDPERQDNVYTVGKRLNPVNRADNFFTALTTSIDEFRQGDGFNQDTVSRALEMLERMRDFFMESRGEAGARISRMDVLISRYTDEEVTLESQFGKKITPDIITMTDKFLREQQIYQTSMTSSSRIMSLSLFNYI